MRRKAAAVLLAALAGCSPDRAPPADSAAIESVGILATQAGQPEALARLSRWARQGHPVAQREYALALMRTTAAPGEVLLWLERAARGGDGEAAYLAGQARLQGRWGLQANPAAATPWLERAANAGHADAALALARLWRNGEAGQRSDSEALRWLQRASEQGNAQAMLLLSNAYAEGLGTPVRLDQARHWLEAAADRHFPAALQAYALALESGALGFERDPQEAQHLMKEATEERRNRWNSR